MELRLCRLESRQCHLESSLCRLEHVCVPHRKVNTSYGMYKAYYK